MFHAIEIARFRGFQQLRLDPLDRFNLIIGRNNVGKTALLEAIFLLLGPNNPELPLRVNVFRGIEQFRNDPEELWGWLFYKKDLTRAIELEARANGKQRRLYLQERAAVAPQPVQSDSLLLVEGNTPAHFFEALARSLGIGQRLEIRNYGGINQFARFLQLLASTTDFQAKVLRLGIARDAEGDPESAKRSLNRMTLP